MADSPAAIMNIHRSLSTQPIGNKERNNQSMAKITNMYLECGMQNLGCAEPFGFHIHDKVANSNESGVKRLITVKACCSLKG
jgi:hypothetical protein